MGSQQRKDLGKKAVDALGSLLTTLLIFAAIPAVLVTVVGYPLGDGLGHQWGVPARAVLTGLTLVAWVAWLACCTQLTRSVVTQVRRGHVTTPVGAVLTERVAARIAAGVLSLIAVAAPLFVASTAGASSATTASTIGVDAARAVTTPAAAVPLAPVPFAAVAATYVVHQGDSLWSIAEAQLGDGGDWPAIAALNLGRTMPDGAHFVDPGLIDPGWTLQLPGAGVPLVSPIPTHQLGDDIRATALTLPATSAAVTPTSVPLHGRAPRGSSLPELSALGIGALACCALARRSRRIRMLRQMSGDEPAAAPEHTDAAIETDIQLARFSGVPSLLAFEAANYRLGLVMEAMDADDVSIGTTIRAVCVGAAGVDFWLGQAGRPAPDGFSLSVDGKAWHAAHDTSAPQGGGARPFLPIVLPIGEDQDGTWIIPLTAGACLPLVGEGGDDLWRAARRVQEAWAWADLVVVTEDPMVVAREVALLDDNATADDLKVLFFGDPASISDTHRTRVAIVSTAVAAPSDVTVLVDRNAASIHPLGRTVRPHLMRPETSALVDQLVTSPPQPAREEETALSPVVERRPIPAHAGPVSLPDPGTVMVRLLTQTPRLEGLNEEIAPNRARRAIELVAYLALHADSEVTSDRLRTRVLGSSDADAASKTLFNIAAAARRAMGADEDGALLFPSGTRGGIYRVSDGVTVDVHLAASIASEGSATEDPQEAMALLHAALSLVEGEPLANVLSGYGWWEAEGHGARTAAVLVHAASDLAALAADAQNFDLAQWGLGQARLVDPYSESLSRVAMQVAAAAGDADRLRREWRECRRRIDELDPGSSPSPRTERLYGELAQRVLVGVTCTPRID